MKSITQQFDQIVEEKGEVKMTKYKCIKPLVIDSYNDEHMWEGNRRVVEVDSVWEVDTELSSNYVGTNEAVHLNKVTEPTDGEWIEVYSETIAEHFEQIS